RVQTAGNPGGGVKGQVVLHGSKVRQAGLAHGGSLPIFFEPAAVITVDIKVDNAQTIDIGGFNVHAETAFLCRSCPNKAKNYWPLAASVHSTPALAVERK